MQKLSEYLSKSNKDIRQYAKDQAEQNNIGNNINQITGRRYEKGNYFVDADGRLWKPVRGFNDLA